MRATLLVYLALLYSLLTYQSTAQHEDLYVNNNQQLPLPSSDAFSFVFIVGIEGVGHHWLHPLLTEVAWACGRHFVPEKSGKMFSSLETLFWQHDDTTFRYMMNQTFFHTKNSTVIFSASFPYDWVARGFSVKDIKKKPHYDIEWIVRNIRKVNMRNQININMKFLYLTRDTYDTVLSHCDFEIHRAGYTNETKCIMHTDVLERYTQHIANEYAIIESLQPDMWKQIKYEWFLRGEQCEVLVSSLVGFLGWGNTNNTNCDALSACEAIKKKRRRPSSRPLDCKDFHYIMSKNLTLPIPDLPVPVPLLGVNDTLSELRRLQCPPDNPIGDV
jgi:hypothetical protein